MKSGFKKVVVVFMLLMLIMVLSACSGPEFTYKSAQSLLSQGKYVEAGEKFESIGSYEDASTLTMYCKACALCEAGNYEEGFAIFESLKGFKDCAYRITYYEARSYEDNAKNETWRHLVEAQEIYKEIPAFLDSEKRIAMLDNGIYDAAVELMETGNHSESYAAFKAVEGHKDSAAKVDAILINHPEVQCINASVGDYIRFGSYEQDNNVQNGQEPIEWQVLVKQSNRLLVISRYALDSKPYNEKGGDTTWEQCSLRKWLNNDFLNTAFSETEKSLIPTVTVSAGKNPSYNTHPGKATQDKVFLLSIEEVNACAVLGSFVSYRDRQCQATAYAQSQGVFMHDNGYCVWQLRTPGKYKDLVAYVSHGGGIDEYGGTASLDANVRPALWIEFEQ